MIIYGDTSFLVSFLYEGDANHKTARQMAERFDGHDFIVCQVQQLELPAALMAATHRKESPVPAHVARLIINRFERAWNGHRFVRRELPLDESISMARSFGETHGWHKRPVSISTQSAVFTARVGLRAVRALPFPPPPPRNPPCPRRPSLSLDRAPSQLELIKAAHCRLQSLHAVLNLCQCHILRVFMAHLH